MKDRHICISHADDLDGVASAILLTHYIEETYNALPQVMFTNYDDVVSTIEQAAAIGTHLWVSDLSVRSLELAQSLTGFSPDTLHFFDHHADTQAFVDSISPYATVYFDCTGTKCAADLIWDFMKSKANPEDTMSDRLAYLVSATHSRDLWINDVPEGATLSAVIAMLGPEKSYRHLMENINRVREFTELMNFCVRVADDMVEKAKNVANASVVTMFYRPDSPKSCAAGLTVIAALTTGCQSEVGDMLLQKTPLAIVGLINLDKIGISFRTTKEVIQKLGGFGVNNIAKTIEGGGGHPYAAGAPLTTEMLLAGPKALLSMMTKAIDEHALETEGIKAR